MAETRLSEGDVRAIEPDPKIGLVATVGEDGRPHVTLLATLSAKDPASLMFGQFCEGRSKDNVRRDPRVGFLIMDGARRFWRGRARWTRAERTGPDVDAFNAKPLYRYNAYFGIHTVHHLALVALDQRGRLSIPRLLVGAGLGLAASAVARARAPRGERILTPWAERHLGAPTTLGFLAWRDDDGFPRLMPGVALRPAGARRLVLAPSISGATVAALAPGTPVSVFALNLKMESVLVGGPIRWRSLPAGNALGVVDIDRVYNTMPPLAGPVYPRSRLEPVRSF